jgi:hypothetical protein
MSGQHTLTIDILKEAHQAEEKRCQMDSLGKKLKYHLWPTRYKIFTNWLFTEKAYSPCSRATIINKNKEVWLTRVQPIGR